MASVNKIKELAESRNYDVAVDILDAQDLDKSLNPQFVRTCGEIYENVGRYKDARKQYVRAHIMAENNSRVIESLMTLYLKRGFKELAGKYYEHYLFVEKNSERKLDNIKYIMRKAEGAPYSELFDLIYPYYRDNMDEDWSFELIMLAMKMDKDDMDVILSDYMATYKNSKNIELLYEIVQDRDKLHKYFDIFSSEEHADDDEAEEEVRKLEAEQLEKDYYIRNPKDPEILIMVDDTMDELTEKQKRKLRKKSLKEALKNKNSGEDSDEASEASGEGTDSESTEEADKADNEAVKEKKDGEGIKRSLKDFIKRKFRREETPETDEEGEDSKEAEKAAKDESSENADKSSSSEAAEVKETEAVKETEESGKTEAEKNSAEAEKTAEESKEAEAKAEDSEKEPSDTAAEVKAAAEDTAEKTTENITEKSIDDKTEVTGKAVASDDQGTDRDMRELKPETNLDDFITYDFDDGFAPESDSIAELDDEVLDFSNPFDSISAYKKDEEEKRKSETEASEKTPDDLRIGLEISNVDESTSYYEPDRSDETPAEDEVSIEIEEDTAEEAETETAAEAESAEAVTDTETEAESETEAEAESKAEAAAEAGTEETGSAEDVSDLSNIVLGEAIQTVFDVEIPEDDEEISDVEIEIPEDMAAVVVDTAVPEDNTGLEALVEESVSTTYAADIESSDDNEEAAETSFESAAEASFETTEETAGAAEESFETAAEESKAAESDDENAENIIDKIKAAALVNTADVSELQKEVNRIVTDASKEEVKDSDTGVTDGNETVSSEEALHKVDNKDSLGYPEFKSSLFDVKKDDEEKSDNDFDALAKKESEKLEEKLRMEEEMQRQAEKLLESLGIKL